MRSLVLGLVVWVGMFWSKGLEVYPNRIANLQAARNAIKGGFESHVACA